MDSFFFNITDTSYKVTKLFENKKEHITRVDISNGIVFMDINILTEQELHPKSTSSLPFTAHVKNLDRMIAITVTKKGSFSFKDNLQQKVYDVKEDSINIFASSRQDISLNIDESEKTEIFILFIADFILKRYLSSNQNEVINYLYNTIQKELTCREINSQPIDALSLYLIEKITKSKKDEFMNSIRCEKDILEFMIHRFKLIDMQDDKLSDEEVCISRSAKSFLLHSFTSPPSIQTLAHLCATNESKLKKVFKKAYNTTIYGYIQKLRLEKANLLLKEQYLNIGEITKEIGYKHQGHFSKLFFEFYGVYPKDLLKK